MKSTIKLLTYVIFFFTLTLTSISCDGEDGSEGPIGQDGNANVISVLLEDQTISDGNNVFDIPQLTQEIYDTGIVYAYVTVNGNDYWEVLPLSLSEQIILEIDNIAVGRITLKATFTQSNLKLRFVLVEGNDASGADFSNYKEIETIYGLD